MRLFCGGWPACAGGQTYYFTVTAYDSITGVESVFSDEVSTTLPPSAGSAPRSFITLEAASMALTGYVWESNADASGGAVISRRGAMGLPSGVALAAFPGPVGPYEIIVSYFDENDGQSTLTLTVNGQVVDTWVAQADLPSGDPGAVTLTYRVVTTRVTLALGDVITLEGREQSSAYAHVDKVDFVLIDDGLQ